jgi:hypothetical protein
MTGLVRLVLRYWGCRYSVDLHSRVFLGYYLEGQWSCYRTILSRSSHFASGRQTRNLLVLLRLSSCVSRPLDMVFPNVGE